MTVTPKGQTVPMAPTNINLFFLKKASFACIVTTQSSIRMAYDRVINVPLESPKPWKKLILRGNGEETDPDILKRFDDTYYYIDVRVWDPAVHQPLFMVLRKKFVDGGQYETDNLLNELGDWLSNIFLEPETVDL